MIDFYQISEDLNTLISGLDYSGLVHPQGESIDLKHFIEAMTREMRFDQMPMTNIRMTEGDFEQRSLPNGYYINMTLMVDVVAFDFTEFKIAANIRDDILRIVMNGIRATPKFSAALNESSIGDNASFGAGVGDEGQNGHVAYVTFEVIVGAYVEAN